MNLGTRQRRRDRRQGAGVGQYASEAAFFDVYDRPPPRLREAPSRASFADVHLRVPPTRQPPLSSDFIPVDGQPVTPGGGCAPGSFGDCGMKIVSKTINAVAGTLTTATITTPGAFCPVRMYILADDIELLFVWSIKSGLDEQIIPQVHEGNSAVTAELFSQDNHCCPVLCLPCICQPAVPYNITILNTDITDEEVTIVLVGYYLDAADPRYQTENGCPPRFLSDFHAPNCPPEGVDKLIPFALALAPGGSNQLTIETPGQFCPRQMFLLSTGATFIEVTKIQSGLKHQIIKGTLPAELFTIDNECCVLACFDCICKPGYPLTIGFRNTDAEGQRLVFGVLIGTYDDACQQ